MQPQQFASNLTTNFTTLSILKVFYFMIAHIAKQCLLITYTTNLSPSIKTGFPSNLKIGMLA